MVTGGQPISSRLRFVPVVHGSERYGASTEAYYTYRAS